MRDQFSVNVSRTSLLTKLKYNRENHLKNFDKAIEIYRNKVIEVLDEALDAAKTGKEYKTYFNMVRPENMLDEYNEVIGMLEMSTDDIIELSQQQYANYVMDKWGWSDRFVANTLSYVGGVS